MHVATPSERVFQPRYLVASELSACIIQRTNAALHVVSRFANVIVSHGVRRTRDSRISIFRTSQVAHELPSPPAGRALAGALARALYPRVHSCIGEARPLVKYVLKKSIDVLAD